MTANFFPGQTVKNLYGEILTVQKVIDNLMIRTYEQPNDLYHYTKLFPGQNLIKK